VSQPAAGTIWWHPDPLGSARGEPAACLDRARRAALAGAEPSGLAFWALIAFTGILLLTPQAYIPALKVLRVALLAGGIAIAVHAVDATVRRRTVLTASPEVATALTLLAWTVLTIPFSYWPGGSVSLLTDQYLKTIVFFWLIATLVTTRKRLRTLGWTFVICSIPLAIVALKNFASGTYLTSRENVVQRIAGLSGLTGNPNDLALTLNLFIPIAGALFLVSRGWAPRALAAVAMLLSVPAVIVTFSRAGFLTLCAIAVMTLVFAARRRAAGPALAILLVAASAVPFLPEGYLARVNTITDIEADRTGSAQGRWEDIHLALQVTAEHPVIGVGLGQDLLALDQVRERPNWRSVHNAFLQYSVDLGLPGFLLFLGLIIATFRSARRVERRAAQTPAMRELMILASGVQVALVAFLVGAFFAPIAYQFYFFCVAGLAVALKNACRTEISVLAAAPLQRGEV
jgi:probable O-glycosylation ligase (exosortase A-associated)